MSEPRGAYAHPNDAWMNTNSHYIVFFNGRGSKRFVDISMKCLLERLKDQFTDDEPVLVLDEADNDVYFIVPTVEVVEYRLKY